MDYKDAAEDGKTCPIATRDIAVNLRNRQKAISDAGYGPLNPKKPNKDFWQKKAERWDVTASDAKTQICGNCAAFVVTKRMMDCIEAGLGNESGNAAWDVIEAGELGYCEAFDFKCASKRTCDAWIVGGPVKEEKNETKSLPIDEDLPQNENEKRFSAYLDSLSDEEFDNLYPESLDDDAEVQVKVIFDVLGGYARRAITNRRRRRKRRGFGKGDQASVQTKAAKPVLRDPKGGLTAAGRAHFRRKEGSNLKPGVKGPANTPTKMRRKGSFLVRFFTNPSGPMVDEKGRPTRLALSAAAWGEPVPKNRSDAAKLAAKGRRLLERYRKSQEKR